MNAVKQQPEWIGYDPGEPSGGETCFAAICGICERVEHLRNRRIPENWDLTLDCGGREMLVCPDCNERHEQKKIADLQGRICDYHEQAASITMSADLAEKYRIAIAEPKAFHIFAELQEAGDYRVAISPNAALMRWHPLGFFLTPTEARQTAKDLMTYADIAEKPGTLPESAGAGK